MSLYQARFLWAAPFCLKCVPALGQLGRILAKVLEITWFHIFHQPPLLPCWDVPWLGQLQSSWTGWCCLCLQWILLGQSYSILLDGCLPEPTFSPGIQIYVLYSPNDCTQKMMDTAFRGLQDAKSGHQCSLVACNNCNKVITCFMYMQIQQYSGFWLCASSYMANCNSRLMDSSVTKNAWCALTTSILFLQAVDKSFALEHRVSSVPGCCSKKTPIHWSKRAWRVI